MRRISRTGTGRPGDDETQHCAEASFAIVTQIYVSGRSMATYSTEELARKVLAIYARDPASQDGHVLNQEDLLRQWPKGFTHVELATALDYACHQGWLEQTGNGLTLTRSGSIEAKS